VFISIYIIKVPPERTELQTLFYRVFPFVNQTLILPEISVDGAQKQKFFEYFSPQSVAKSSFSQLAILGTLLPYFLFKHT
jgi:hypothetical protein